MCAPLGTIQLLNPSNLIGCCYTHFLFHTSKFIKLLLFKKSKKTQKNKTQNGLIKIEYHWEDVSRSDIESVNYLDLADQMVSERCWVSLGFLWKLKMSHGVSVSLLCHPRVLRVQFGNCGFYQFIKLSYNHFRV